MRIASCLLHLPHNDSRALISPEALLLGAAHALRPYLSPAEKWLALVLTIRRVSAAFRGHSGRTRECS